VKGSRTIEGDATAIDANKAAKQTLTPNDLISTMFLQKMWAAGKTGHD
jgi:hypothetical protein